MEIKWLRQGEWSNCMYACMCVCMYVRMHACMYVCMYREWGEFKGTPTPTRADYVASIIIYVHTYYIHR